MNITVQYTDFDCEAQWEWQSDDDEDDGAECQQVSAEAGTLIASYKNNNENIISINIL